MSATDVALGPIRKEPVDYRTRIGPFSSESILLYLTVGGCVIPMRVLDSDSIASVKLRIQTCKGFVVKKQKIRSIPIPNRPFGVAESTPRSLRVVRPPPKGQNPFFFFFFFFFFWAFGGGWTTPLAMGVVRPPPDRPWGWLESPPISSPPPPFFFNIFFFFFLFFFFYKKNQ
jgi:hypothetical protein